jgi:hypothetical protein
LTKNKLYKRDDGIRDGIKENRLEERDRAIWKGFGEESPTN